MKTIDHPKSVIDPVISDLTTRERALLAAFLWESIEDPFELSVSFEDGATLGN